MENSKESRDRILDSAASSSTGAVVGAIVTAVDPTSAILGAAIGGAASGLLTALGESPAARANQERVDAAFLEINERLSHQGDLIRNLNDCQYKLVCESVLAVSRAANQEKIDFLKTVIFNAVSYGNYNSYESILLSRIIRDITAEETAFLIENFQFKSVHIYSWFDKNDTSIDNLESTSKLDEKVSNDGGVLFMPNTDEAYIVNGLFNLGVLCLSSLSLGVHVFSFTDVTVKLIALLTRKP